MSVKRREVCLPGQPAPSSSPLLTSDPMRLGCNPVSRMYSYSSRCSCTAPCTQDANEPMSYTHSAHQSARCRRCSVASHNC